jgi:hypothetical protein
MRNDAFGIQPHCHVERWVHFDGRTDDVPESRGIHDHALAREGYACHKTVELGARMQMSIVQSGSVMN